ncbi:hypothetical protein [Paracoccus denitrificans]|uniref:hypothetical protein n=1 Tax=Paracoccus denitrificans TaxID=266 RepID=UPI003364BE91
MRTLVATSAIIVLITSAYADESSPHQLKARERSVIEHFVANETAIPERTRVNGIVAATSDSGLIYACGYVSWIDSDGIFGPFRPFSGYLGTNEAGEEVFSVGEIARDDRNQQRIERNCDMSGAPIIAAEPAIMLAPPEPAATAIEQFENQHRECVDDGGYDASSPSPACIGAMEASSVVSDMGWCEVGPIPGSPRFHWRPCS